MVTIVRPGRSVESAENYACGPFAPNVGTEGSYTNENQWNREFKKRLQPLFEGTIWKVNDRVQPGIPDFILFNTSGGTLFLESKRVPGKLPEDPASLLSAKQLEFLKQRAGQHFPTFVIVSSKLRPGMARMWWVGGGGAMTQVRDYTGIGHGWAEMLSALALYFNGIKEW